MRDPYELLGVPNVSLEQLRGYASSGVSVSAPSSALRLWSIQALTRRLSFPQASTRRVSPARQAVRTFFPAVILMNAQSSFFFSTMAVRQGL